MIVNNNDADDGIISNDELFFSDLDSEAAAGSEGEEGEGEGAEGEEGAGDGTGDGEGDGTQGSQDGDGDGTEGDGDGDGNGTEGDGEGDGAGDGSEDDKKGSNLDNKGERIDPKLDDDGKNIDDTDGADLSGIEQYLSQFDIDAGIIQFEDGTSQHFDELDPAKQAEILSQLHDQQSSSVEDKFGLDQSEIGLINYMRENNTTPQQMIEQLANERVETILAAKSAGDQNYEEMTEDAVYMNFLKRSNPEAETEQLENDLAKAKEQTNYKGIVGSLRTQFKTEQANSIENNKQIETQNRQKELGGQRKAVLDKVVDMKDVDGIQLNDGIKNGILDHVLEVNDHGDSLFMEEVFSNPDTLFKAAFWFYNGSELMKQRDDYWKKEKSSAYKRGRQDALGKDGDRISFNKDKGGSSKNTSKSTPSKNNDNDDFQSLDSIHLDS